MNATDPYCSPRSLWFVTWVIGGVVLVVLTWVFSDLYYERYWNEATFQPVKPPPGYQTRLLLFESVTYTPLASLAYAVSGGWVYRSRGCLAVGCAVLIAVCSWGAQVVHGLGRL